MKIGARDRRTVAVAAGFLLVAAALVVRWVMSGDSASQVRGASVGASTPALLGGRNTSFDPTLRFEALRDTEATMYQGSGRNIFRVVQEHSKVEAVRRNEAKVTEPAKVAEPIPLSFFGFSRKGGVSTVFLLKGQDVFLAREGDIVDRRYKIRRVRPDAVDVEDLLGERSERLVLRRG
jgi:hypothetical protein